MGSVADRDSRNPCTRLALLVGPSSRGAVKSQTFILELLITLRRMLVQQCNQVTGRTDVRMSGRQEEYRW